MNPRSYMAKLVRVIDGDTYELIVDLGFDIHVGMSGHWHFRLMGADTPEIFGKKASEEGRLASDFVKKLLWQQPTWFRIDTHKTSSGEERKTLGRFVVSIWLTKDENGDHLEEPIQLAGYLIEKGHAV